MKQDCRPQVDIPEVNWEGSTSCDSIVKISENWSKPVVIRGLRNSSRTRMNREYWSQYGDVEVRYRNQSLIYTHSGYGETKTMLLSDILVLMDSGERLYVDFNNELTKTYPEILRDMGMDPVVCERDAYFGELYFGYGHAEHSTGTKIHSEILDNIMVVVEGSRTLHLHPPHCNGLMKPTMSNGHAYNNEWRLNKPLTRDGFESDHHDFLWCCDLNVATLHTGDSIYIPPWWLHDIINQPNPEKNPQFMLSVSSRALRLPAAMWQKPDWTMYTVLRNVHRLFESKVEIQDGQHNAEATSE